MNAILNNAWFIPLATTAVVILIFPLLAGYIVLLERKVLAHMQVRLGPMRVGPHGLLQPLADALKLILKEDIVPTESARAIFWLAPVLSTFTGLLGFTVLPFSRHIFIADVNIGILVIAATSSVGILGIILGGWSSNSHYPLLGSLRSAAQLVSYEIALGLAMLSGLMAAGTLSMQGIIEQQQQRHIWFAFDNFGFMIVPFVIFVIAVLAETNRLPFDLPEAESELTGGFHTEYSGFRWALYMLAEYANMFVTSGVAVTLFLGGWLRPFPNIQWLRWPMDSLIPAALIAGPGIASIALLARKLRQRDQQIVLVVISLGLMAAGALFLIPVFAQAASPVFWFLLKIFALIYFMIWLRGTFPRFRYDQLMNIGWKWMIPLGLAAIAVNAVLGLLH